MSSSSNQSNWVFSSIGVVLVAVLLVIANMIISKSRVQFDATEHKLHTLTEGTKNILAGLDDELKKYDSDGERGRLTVRLYATMDKDVMPPYFADHAKKVEAMLREFKARSDDRIQLEVIDPQPYSDEAENAQLNGVMPVPIAQDVSIYLGISVSSLKKNVPIPFLNPQNNSLLEYDIARAITEASITKKPVLGLMSSYELAGGGGAPGRPGGAQPWYIRSMLERDYSVQNIPMSVDKIDSNIDVLMIIHPAGIEDGAQFAIDQYLLGGGKVLAMLDAFSLYNRQSQQQPQQIPGMPPPPGAPVSSNLGKLLKAWGIQFESVNIAADRRFVNRRRPNPVFIGVPAKGISDEHTATKEIQYVDLSFTGAFYGDGADGLEMKVLVESSEDAGTLSPHALFGDETTARSALNNMESASDKLAFVISLQGNFKTAFPDGPPEDEATDPANPDEEKTEGKEKTDNSLKKSSEIGSVILIADTDMITDGNAPQLFRLGQGQVIESPPPNGNLALVSNLLGYLAGNTNLFKVRSRGDNSRPFTKYEEMKKDSEKEQQVELDELIAKRTSAERTYRDIRAKQAEGKEIDAKDLEFLRDYDDKDERQKTSRRIIELRHELNKGVDRIEALWKWINIALVPCVVILAAFGHLMIRKTKTYAR